MDSGKLQAWQPQALAVLRIVVGVLFLSHGVVKLFGFPPGAMPGPQPIASLMGVAGIIELVGGALIAIGWFTRPAAFIASGEMAVAYWMVHAPQSPFPVKNMGEGAILYCFVFLYFVFAGAGAWSVDNRKISAMRE